MHMKKPEGDWEKFLKKEQFSILDDRYKVTQGESRDN